MKFYKKIKCALLLVLCLAAVPVRAFKISFQYNKVRPFFHPHYLCYKKWHCRNVYTFTHPESCVCENCWHPCGSYGLSAESVLGFSFITGCAAIGFMCDACETSLHRVENSAASFGFATVSAFLAWVFVKCTRS